MQILINGIIHTPLKRYNIMTTRIIESLNVVLRGIRDLSYFATN